MIPRIHRFISFSSKHLVPKGFISVCFVIYLLSLLVKCFSPLEVLPTFPIFGADELELLDKYYQNNTQDGIILTKAYYLLNRMSYFLLMIFVLLKVMELMVSEEEIEIDWSEYGLFILVIVVIFPLLFAMKIWPVIAASGFVDLVQDPLTKILRNYWIPFIIGILIVVPYILKKVIDKYLESSYLIIIPVIISAVLLVISNYIFPIASQTSSLVAGIFESLLNLFLVVFLVPIISFAIVFVPKYFPAQLAKRVWFTTINKSYTLFGRRFNRLKTIEYRYRRKFFEDEHNQIITLIYSFVFRSLGLLFIVGSNVLFIKTISESFGWKINTHEVFTVQFLLFEYVLLLSTLIKSAWINQIKKDISTLPYFFDSDYYSLGDTLKETSGDHSNESSANQTTTNIFLNRIGSAFLPGLFSNKEITKKHLSRIVNVLVVLLIFISLGLASILLGNLTGLSIGFNLLNSLIVIFTIFCIGISFAIFTPLQSVLGLLFYHEEYRIINSQFINYEEVYDKINANSTISSSSGVDHSELLKDQLKIIKPILSNLEIPTIFFKQFLIRIGFGKLTSDKLLLIGYSYLCTILGLFLFGFLSLDTFLSDGIISFKNTYFNTILIVFALFLLFLLFPMFITKKISLMISGGISDGGKKFWTLLVVVPFIVYIMIPSVFYWFNDNKTIQSITEYLLEGDDSNSIESIPRHEQRELSLEEFAQNLGQQKTLLFYNSFGGGTRSNIWTNVLLNGIHKRLGDSIFFRSSVSFSGVSGGSMGFINYSAIHNSLVDKELNRAEYFNEFDKILLELSGSDFLGSDIVNWIGVDQVKNITGLTINPLTKDRSNKAMFSYAYKTDNVEVFRERISFRENWLRMYNQNNQKFPILISNSNRTDGNHAIAVSVSVDNSKISKILYKGAVDVLDIPFENSKLRHTLTYYDAASLSNRFPILSPVAKIGRLGYFNDGGLFDNSGMVASLNLIEAITNVEGNHTTRPETYLISFRNDKLSFVKSVLDSLLNPYKTYGSQSENSATLNSVAATNALPNYLKSLIKTRSNSKSNRSSLGIVEFLLPYRISYDDIREIYGENIIINNPELLYPLEEILEKNNDTIRHLISKELNISNPLYAPVIEPSMSRFLSKSSYIYMKAMLEHPSVNKSLDTLQHILIAPTVE